MVTLQQLNQHTSHYRPPACGWYYLLLMITIPMIAHSSLPYYLPYNSMNIDRLDQSRTPEPHRTKSGRYYTPHHSDPQDQSIVSSYNILISSKLRNSQQQLTKQQTNFTHLALDTRTEQLYIGATNYLLKFDSNLRLIDKKRTGPVDDSSQCSPTDCFSVDAKEIKPTNNYNKILLVDSLQRQLIVCGSVKQGACYQLPLEDDPNASNASNASNANQSPTSKQKISDSDLLLNEMNLIRVPVGANDENSSSVAFIGPANYGHEKLRVMYVAVTNTRLGQYREIVPAISARSLNINNQDTFRIIESSFTDTARLDISSHLRDYYLVHYIYGFHYHDQIYFAQVQKRSHLRTQEEFGYHTRLSRICSSDAGFKSYTELTLECLVEGESRTINYNVLKAATLTRVDSNLADGLGLRSMAGNSMNGNNEVFIGVFSLSKDHSVRHGDHSAVCAFSMNDIERRFKENIHLCYNGSIKSRNMDHYIAGSINECPEPGKAGNILNFCEETVKINGSLSLSGVPLFKIDGTELTAIAVSTPNQLHTVAMLGTGNGKLLKVLLRPEISESKLFEIVNIDPNEPILSDLLFDTKQKYVYVATSKKIAKVLVERCSEQSNCSECLHLNNPYCGWCALMKRCTSKSDCLTRDEYNSIQDTRTTFSTPRWLPMDSAQCINFERITPSFLPINKRQNLHLTIHQLPILPYGSSYRCVFNDKISTAASIVSNGLTCPAPELNERPIIDVSDHVTVHLAVKATTSDTAFIQRTFAFYDCNVHKTCRSCVSSEFACTWCKTDSTCMSNQSSCDDRMSIFSEHSLSAYYYNAEKGANYCPSFKVDSEIILANGASKEITLKVQNLNGEQDGFQCMMEIEGARELVKASVQNEQLVCSRNVYTYLADVSQYRAQLTVLRNREAFIDRTNVTLYKCELMGSHNGKADCSLCQSSASRFQCAFCAGRCAFKEECGNEEPTICPPPRIESVHPLSGPIEGGTILTIEGSNLGSSIDQLKNKISIGSAACEPIQVIASVRVICKTQAPDKQDQQFHSSKVVVANSAGLTFSNEKFHFKKIELKHVVPTLGPKSGGTLLYLSGENLNIGSNLQVYLDEIKCDVDKQLLSSKQLTCRTRPSEKARLMQKLTLIVDNVNLTINRPFLYTENPTIKRITPDQSFLSGGRILNVFGERFQSIQSPKMGVFYQKQLINETYCTVVNNTLMLCPTPSVKEFYRHMHLYITHLDQVNSSRTQNGSLIDSGLSAASLNSLATFDNQIDDPDLHKPSDDNQISGNLHASTDHQQAKQRNRMLKLKISFGLDNSLRTLPLIGLEQQTSGTIYTETGKQQQQQQQQQQSSTSLTSNQDDQQDDEEREREEEEKNYFAIKYVQDPKVYKLDQSATSFNGHLLVIQGENLNYAINPNELNVSIAGAPCSLTSLTENQLICSAIIDRLTPSYRRKLFKDKSTDQPNSNLLTSLLSIRSSGYEEQSIRSLPVIVRFSENLEFHLGYLTSEDSTHFRKLNHDEDGGDDGSSGNERFFSGENSEKQDQKLFVKGVVICGVLLIIFCLILLISFKRKSNEVEKQYKQMQLIIIDSLENSVRLECKQAFAELQTDLSSEVNNVNQDYSVALLPSVKFLSNIFFPGLGLNPLSPDYKHLNGQLFYHNNSPSANNNGQLLEELLFSKHFLLTFIDVLEQQPSFTLRDRVNVASLLMITLIDKMDYAFSILEELLVKSVETYSKSKHPQLFLRRTEFIVEKFLSNFLSMALEEWLSEESGNQLFLLCNAIKSQVEKGPIDYYTQEARYTLAEERLLKQQIEFDVINLIVFKLNSSLNEKSEYQVRVLDCDCISQVKNKILDVVYRNVPKSRRPELSDVILEHNYILNQTYSLKRTGHHLQANNNTNSSSARLTYHQQPIYGQSIILEDDDDTTQTTQEDLINWRQINTVKHYQLMNNSIVLMRVLNEQPNTEQELKEQKLDYHQTTTDETLNDESQFNYTIYDNYADSGTGHLYECIEKQDHSGRGQLKHLQQTKSLLTKSGQHYFDQINSLSKYSTSHNLLSEMLETSTTTTGTMMSSRLLKQIQQQMPLPNMITNRKTSSYNVYYTLNGINGSKKPGVGGLMRNDSLITSSTTTTNTTTTADQTVRNYHLTKEIDHLDTNSNSSSTNATTIASSTLRKAFKNRTDDVTQNKKLIKEIYLTRLLTTKGTLQKYIDDFFSSVLVCKPNKTPIVIKWLFDLLDDTVQANGIDEPDIIYLMKGNSLPLRFWVNLIKNPNFLFDLEKTPVLDCNLNVIAQAFLDSCLLDHQVLNKESHSAKLLFARDIPRYREMVRQYYDDIRALPRIRKEQMLTELKNCSKKFQHQIDRSNAINELLVYTARYREVLLNAFYNDPTNYYSNKLQTVLESIYSTKS